MNLKFKTNSAFPKYEIISQLILITFLIIYGLIFINYHFIAVTNPFPLQGDEGHTIVISNIMLQGGNPYDIINQPASTNMYGIVYFIIAYPFAELFGLSFLILRLLSASFIFLTCYLIFKILRQKGVSIAFSFAAMLILYAHFLGSTEYLARPDSLGVFLFLLSIYLPWKNKYSPRSICFGIIFGILAFYTKPYFILSIPYILSYTFIFISKKKALISGVIAFFLFLISIVIVNFLFECYLSNTIFVNFHNASHRIDYAISQIKAYIIINKWLFVILFIQICFLIITIFEKRKNIYSKLKSMDLISRKINITKLNKPLFTANVDIFLFSLCCSVIMFLISLGQHDGSWLNYAFQTISPFFVIVLFDNNKIEKIAILKFIACILIIVHLLIFSERIKLYGHNYLNEWGKINSLLLKYNNIYNSTFISALIVEQGKKVYDDGHTAYFHFGTTHNVFPQIDKLILNRHNEYLHFVNNSIMNKKFDLVVTYIIGPAYVDKDILKKYYKILTILPAPIPYYSQMWELEFWVPI